MALALAGTAWLLLSASPGGAATPVSWRPASLRPGDVALVIVPAVGDSVTVEGSLAGQALAFFRYADGVAALAAIDFEARPGRYDWTIAIVDKGRAARTMTGRVRIRPRRFDVERLTLPADRVDLDEESARRAEAEAERLRSLLHTVTGERLWRGRFTAPVAPSRPPTSFGARRIINGQPRSPHGGLDYAAERGTPVVAANSGRVALVADFFFPGQLVVVDHGFGLHTAYFHLDRISVAEGDLVDRGHPIGLVGSTGRATGPHLHFSAAIGPATIDPAALLRLHARD